MTRHIGTGIGWGIVATISMSTFHLLAKWLGLFPVWPPTPAAVVKRMLGSGSSSFIEEGGDPTATGSRFNCATWNRN